MATTQPITNLGEIVDRVLVAARPYVARLNRLGVQFRSNPERPGKKVDVPVVQVAEATEFDRSTNNYGDSAGSIGTVEVSLSSHPKTTLAVTPDSYDNLGESATLVVDAVATEQAGIEVGTAALKAYHNLLPGASATTNAQMTLDAVAGSLTKKSFTKILASALKGVAAASGRPALPGLTPAMCSLVLSADYYAEALALVEPQAYDRDSNPVRDGWFEGGLFGFRDVVCDPLIASSSVAGYVVPFGTLALAARPVAVRNPAAYAGYEYREDDRSGLSLTIRTKLDDNVDDRITTVEALFGGKVAFPAQILTVLPHA